MRATISLILNDNLEAILKAAINKNKGTFAEELKKLQIQNKVNRIMAIKATLNNLKNKLRDNPPLYITSFFTAIEEILQGEEITPETLKQCITTTFNVFKSGLSNIDENNTQLETIAEAYKQLIAKEDASQQQQTLQKLKSTLLLSKGDLPNDANTIKRIAAVIHKAKTAQPQLFTPHQQAEEQKNNPPQGRSTFAEELAKLQTQKKTQELLTIYPAVNTISQDALSNPVEAFVNEIKETLKRFLPNDQLIAIIHQKIQKAITTLKKKPLTQVPWKETQKAVDNLKAIYTTTEDEVNGIIERTVQKATNTMAPKEIQAMNTKLLSSNNASAMNESFQGQFFSLMKESIEKLLV